MRSKNFWLTFLCTLPAQAYAVEAAHDAHHENAEVYADVVKVGYRAEGALVLTLHPVESRKPTLNGGWEKISMAMLDALDFEPAKAWKMFGVDGAPVEDARFAVHVLLPFPATESLPVMALWKKCSAEKGEFPCSGYRGIAGNLPKVD